MEDYKPNSHRFKEEQASGQGEPPVGQERKKIEKVIKGTVKTKKKGGVTKLAELFVSEDVKDVKSYIVMDILVPALKDAVINGITMFLYGSSGKNRKTSTTSNVSYRSYYDQRNSRYGSEPAARTRTGYNYDDIILDSRGEAEAVLAGMSDIIETYGVVSVADLYDLVGKSCEYTDNKYGWTNIRNAEAFRVSNGYMLKLPKVTPIYN